MEHQDTEDQLETENTFENEINSKGKLKENKEIRQCDPCHFDNVKESANSFCVVCLEYLCRGCSRDHRKSKATRNHKVLSDKEMPDDPKMFKLMKSLVSCPDHPEMEVSIKCKTHEKLICTKCLVVSHRKCDEVIEISNQTAEDECSATPGALNTLIDRLKAVHEMTVSVRHAKEQNIEQIHTDNSRILMEISDYINSLQEHLLKLEDMSKSDTANILSKILSNLQNDVDRCKGIELEEIEKKGLLEFALKFGNMSEVSIICEKAEIDIKDYKDVTTKLKENPEVNLRFERNQGFEDMDSVGTVNIVNVTNEERVHDGKTYTKETIPELTSETFAQKPFNDREDLQRKSFMTCSVSNCRIMCNIQTTTSEPSCSVSSILTFSDDGRVVLADYFNKRIKVMNSAFSVQIVKKLEGKPICMCQYLKNHLVIITAGSKCLKKFEIAGDKMYHLGDQPCNLFPISIGSGEYWNQVVVLFSDVERNVSKRSDYNQVVLQIRHMYNGRVLRTFNDFRNKSWLKIVLENPRQICKISKTQNEFLLSGNMKLHCFVTDQDNKKLLREKWYLKGYKGNMIPEITDIVTDKEGNIYVCGKGSKNIHQISGINYLNNRVLFTVTGIPLSLCIDDNNRQLIVGCENDNFIYIIKLE